MDVVLARTFLAVLTAGNFQAAAGHLFVTQSAVSLRIKKLEELLGRPVFTRGRAGVELTPAGERFERFARSMVKLWEEASYQVAVPEGLDSMVMVGCQYSLWPHLGVEWLSRLERTMPRTAVKAEVGMPDRLLRMMLDGLLDIAVMYTPQLRPGLEVRPLIDDTLVLAATDPDYPATLDERYVAIAWSPEFLALQRIHFPDHAHPRVSLALGTLAARYVLAKGGAAYFPARAVEEFVADGRLSIVSDAPAFPYPAYVVWNPDKAKDVLKPALDQLFQVATLADRRQQSLVRQAGVEEIDTALASHLTEAEGSHY